ncbi:TlpA family protein disulfide reductase [Riemerella columbipharyngis]|uniref:AhpC/TSA family protein n=1 Tax=Riemerella columbipharyngis TaxID=1071918 RepID=A0A1G7A3U8_9FLAO|nr:TlpA disulfide reductase family protein [Riemerella columbipharyngis]SDE09450.1 AhpC/TSA family protein [Riemerella columbipharyngis]
MKKTLLGLCIALAVVACKKKETTTEISAGTETQAENTLVSEKIKEVNTGHLRELLNPKSKDTLYVVNFFATWCGPCMAEIPHFKEKIEELKDQPVKFTFISLDEKEDWDTKVKDFAKENGLLGKVYTYNGKDFPSDFFKENFKEWDGSSIPFTIMKKGDKSEEVVGSMTKDYMEKLFKEFE